MSRALAFTLNGWEDFEWWLDNDKAGSISIPIIAEPHRTGRPDHSGGGDLS